MSSQQEILQPDHEHTVRTEDASTHLLQGVASTLIVITHSCFEKITYLPFPVGTIIKNVEELVDPWTHPFVEAVEGFSLAILGSIDDQIYAVGTTVEGCILCTSGKLRSLPPLLYRRGLIGISADLWVRYEADMKENVQRALDLASRFPVLNLITPIFCAISSPLARAISDWLVKQSEVQEKSIQPSYEVFLVAKENLTELEPKAVQVETLNETNHVLAGKDTITSAGKDTIISAEEGIQEVAELDEPNGEKIDELDDKVKSHEEKDATDVLEMIDSGWLLGSTALSPKRLPSSPKAFSSPRSSNSRSRKGFLKSK